ncbi:MAG: EB domain-containing protein, partial [Chitinophagales bacterium]
MKNKILGAFLMIAILLASCGDGCKNVECLNGGVCDEGTCMCPDGYIGDDCGEAVNAAYLGEWEMPCAGSINIIGLGEQEIPELTTTINLESNGTPNEIALDFTIPLVNLPINLVGVVGDDGVIT